MAGDRRRRKLMTFLWSLALAVLVIALIYLEKTAILYILCTLGVCVLLMIVALADLAHGENQNQQLAQAADAAGVAGKAK
jgi:hypothetical protein